MFTAVTKLLFWRRKPKRDKSAMPPGYRMCANEFNYAYLREKDKWLNYGFETPAACIKRAWEDYEHCNYTDSEGKVHRNWR